MVLFFIHEFSFYQIITEDENQSMNFIISFFFK
jgi:hypothetical protein